MTSNFPPNRFPSRACLVCSLWVLYWSVGAFWNADDARVCRTFATANAPVASRLHSRALCGASLSVFVPRAGVDRQDQGIRPAPNGGADRADRASLRSARAPGWRGGAGNALLNRHPGRTGLLAFPQPGVLSERAERPGKATQSHFKATTNPRERDIRVGPTS